MSDWLEYFIATYCVANLLFMVWRVKIENQLEAVEYDRKVLRRNYEIIADSELHYKAMLQKEMERFARLQKKYNELNKGGEGE